MDAKTAFAAERGAIGGGFLSLKQARVTGLRVT
jgi:hypothetical protein